MKKIGILTFHWATNYGAVVQCYALQQFLKINRYDVEVINYLPFQNILLQRVSWILHYDRCSFSKEKKIALFRKKFIQISKNKFFSNKQLNKISADYDVIISGSDQVMNFSFVEYAEKNHTTLSYYLNFVRKPISRISYAASFGADIIPDKYKGLVKEQLEKFDWVSVREMSAQKMLQEIGVEADVVVDPTLLLWGKDYTQIVNDTNWENCFSYILRSDQKLATNTIKYLENTFGAVFDDNKTNLSVEEWLGAIKNSKFVITNSFHGTVFSILFHRPFIVLPVEGSEMNDRIITLLKYAGLENHFLFEYEESKIKSLFFEEIDWKSVDDNIGFVREQSRNLLLTKLGGV